MVLEKTLESPLDCTEIQPVHSEGDQPWDFFGRNDAKAETPVLWPPHVKNEVKGMEKGMATHSSISCLENSLDRGAGWAAWC